jgi:hypothetical protein
MTASIRGVGADGDGTTSCIAAVPTGGSAPVSGDAMYIFLESCDSTTAAGTPNTPSGWTKLVETTRLSGSTGVTTFTIFGKIAGASEADVTIDGVGNHCAAFMVVVRDHGLSVIGDTQVGSTNGSDNTADTTATALGITTADADTLVLICIGTGRDVTTDNISGYTNANLDGITEQGENFTNSGAGGGVAVATGVKGSAGATGNSTATIGASAWSAVHLGIKPAAPTTSPYTQANFRIRSDDTQGLNTDGGWAAALNTNATIDAEKVFRVRFEVVGSASGAAAQFKLQYRRTPFGGSAGSWVDCPTAPDVSATATHTIDVTDSAQYANDDATTNLLSGSGATFEAGVGFDLDNLSPSITLISEHTEYEWPIKIPISWGATAGTHGRNADGDTYELRVIRSDGLAFEAYTNTPTITLNIPAGQVGGCYPESPCRLMVKDGNGNLYFFMEYAESSPHPLLVKSTDGGDTWAACTTGGEPTQTDLEGADIQLLGDVLHISQTNGSTNVYHQYAVSTHSTTPDQWLVKDQEIENPATSPGDQKISSVVRSDGSVVAAYRGNTANDLNYAVRSTGGTWGSATELDTEAVSWTDVWLQLGESDLVYIFYYALSTGILYYRTLNTSGTLSGRTAIDSTLDTTGSQNEKPIWGTTYYDDGGVEVITVGWKAADDTIYTRQLRDGSLQTAQQVSTTAVLNHASPASSQQPFAHLVNNGTTLWCIFVDASTQDIWKSSNADGAGWVTPEEVLDNKTATFVRGALFTHSAGNGGQTVLGFTYDEGAGGTGDIYYHEFAIVEESSGDGAADLPAISASGDGDVIVSSTTGDADLMPISALGAGSVTDPAISGSGALDLPAIAATGSGDVDVAGSGASNVSAISSSGSGDVDVAGVGDADLTPILASGAGDVDTNGVGDADLMPLLASGVGDVDVAGVGDADLMPINASGTGNLGTPQINGTGDLDIVALDLSGDGTVVIAGTGDADLRAIQASGTGGPVIEGGLAGFAIIGDTTRPEPWTETERPEPWTETERPGWWDGTDRPAWWDGTDRPEPWFETARPSFWTETIFVREDRDVALTMVAYGPFTENEIPEALLIRVMKPLKAGGTAPLEIFNQTPAYTAQVSIEDPAGAAVVTRAAEIMDPADLPLDYPDDFASSEEGWVRVVWQASDFTDVGTYKVQVTLDNGVLLLKSTDVWQPEVNVGPASAVV